MVTTQRTSKYFIWGIMAVLAAIIVAMDVPFPRGETSAMLFVAVVGLTLWLPGWRTVIVVSLVCTLLTVLGFFISAPGPISIDLMNRSFSILAFWLVALLCLVYKRTEQAAHRLATIVESSDDAILSHSLEGVIISWNAGAARLFGYAAKEVVGRSVFCLIPPSRHEDERRLIETIKRGEQPAGYETVRLNKDGGEVAVSISSSPFRGADGTFAGVGSIMRDIRERKRAQAALRQAKEAAEAASRAKGDFLASMSHEIRTPMNGVIGMLGALLDTKLTDQQRYMAEIARSSGDSLLTVINDILDFSRIEAGKLAIEPVSFDLLSTVEDVAAMAAMRAQEKGLDFIIRYSPSAPRYLIGDAGRIRQILTNLVGNAVKFTEKGHIFLNVEPDEVNAEIARLCFRIEDTGVGIPANKLSQIFDRFTQADVSTTRKFGGTGLGLAISKQLVEAMGGGVGVTSEPGKGSVFWFTLPLPRDKEPPPALSKADLAGVRVLIVDDNEVNRHVLHEQMIGWGMRNGSCASGAEALARLRTFQGASDPYQIALLDYQMPDMDGMELARAIKSDPGLRDTVLIMLSSLGQGGDLARFQEAGFAAYLVKPVRPSQLHDALATVWAAHKRGEGTELVTHDRLAEARTPKPAAASRGGPPARVLVVDDNATNQKVARLMLEQQGCRVDVAGNGREAVEMVSLLPYDVVFMDCEMPVLDGFEATDEIRRKEAGKRHVPIVAMAARALQGDRERCLQAGMDDYLSKPLKSANLQSALDRWAPVGAANDAHPTTHPVVDHPPVIDPTVLASLRGMAEATDPTLLGQIVQSFLVDSRSGLVALRQAAGAGDADGLRKAAHSLKGMYASVGARGMETTSQQLESLGDAGSLAGVRNLIDQLENEFRRAESELASVAGKKA